MSRKSQLAKGTLAVGAAVAAAQSTEAATFNVTNLNDNGAGSLRQALADAEALAGADTITFQAGLTGTITLTSGHLYIADSVDIQGPGPAVITVDGNNNGRVFYLYNGDALIDVTISGLTVTGGNAGQGGGIIDFSENMTLDNVVVTGNEAAIRGGGIFVTNLEGDPMSVNITQSSITNNQVTGFGFGGGIAFYLANDIAIDNTTISNNTAYSVGGLFAGYVTGTFTLDTVVISDNDATGGEGGGASFFAIDSGLTIQSSTISGNDAVGNGGGFSFRFSSGDLTVTDSTISGNSVTEGEVTAGGGILVSSCCSDVVIENSTVSGNSAGVQSGVGGGLALYANSAAIRHTTISGNTAASSGGGIYAYYMAVDVSNSIVANNTAPANADLGGAGETFSLSFSLVEDPGTANINDITGNILNQDPQLGPLQNNGGITETHKPAATSPVVNAGDPAFTPPPVNDQRGLPREVPDGELDMGAVELQFGTVQFDVSAENVAENAGVVQITVTRTGGSDGAASVQVNVTGGTATGGGTDYTFSGTVLNWADGDGASKSFNIPVTDDLVFEGNETIILQLATPAGASIGTPSTETVTIVDNETQPTVSVGDRSLNEGNAGTSMFPFDVTLSGPSAFTITVNFTTNPVSATEGTDYADNTGTVTFVPLDTIETINVTVNGDPDVEPDETFEVVLSSPSNTTINDGTGTGTILNDDVVTNTDVSIQKTLASSGPFAVGQNISFTITVTNNGPVAATGVSVSDTIPANTQFVSATPSQGTCSGTTTVTCTLGTINSPGSATIQLVVQAISTGSGTNTATVSAANDSTSANNTAAAAFSVAMGEAPTLSQTMQLILAAMMAMIALGVIGKKS